MYRFGLFTLLFLLLTPLVAYASLININTADAALLDTLPGIGPTKANAIIDYRTTHGSFATIADIQNVSGIGAATYADIAPLITVGEPATPSAPSSATASSSPVTASSTPPISGGIPEYLRTPTLHIQGVKDLVVSVGADTAFTSLIYDSKGNRRTDATVTWSFGDGMRRTGVSVYHAYYAEGEYVLIVRATTSDGAAGEIEALIIAKDSKVHIREISEKYIMLANADTRPIDLSGWRVVAGDQEFRVPEDTYILGEKTLALSYRVTGLPFVGSARLLFPNGDLASVYPMAIHAPRPQVVSPTTANQPVFSESQVEQTIVSDDTSDTQNALAAAGAALESDNGPEDTQDEGISFSPWFLGFIGVVLLAGIAFVFL